MFLSPIFLISYYNVQSLVMLETEAKFFLKSIVSKAKGTTLDDVTVNHVLRKKKMIHNVDIERTKI